MLVQIALTWSNSVGVFDYFKPPQPPTFDSKSNTISAEVTRSLITPRIIISIFSIDFCKQYICETLIRKQRTNFSSLQMCGIVAQLVDAPICSLGGLGSNPVEAWIFQASSCDFSDLLTPKSYQHVIPPYNITDESNIKAMRLRGNDRPSERLLIVEEILLVSTVGIVSKTVERICPPILGFKGLTAAHLQGSFSLLVIITIISFVANVTRRYATRKLQSRGCSL